MKGYLKVLYTVPGTPLFLFPRARQVESFCQGVIAGNLSNESGVTNTASLAWGKC